GVCHESAHRASMVPNLHALPHETNAEYWKNWITQGKAGTLMPAFSQAQGGILTDSQIDSLVSFLKAAIPSHPATAQTPKPPASGELKRNQPTAGRGKASVEFRGANRAIPAILQSGLCVEDVFCPHGRSVRSLACLCRCGPPNPMPPRRSPVRRLLFNWFL